MDHARLLAVQSVLYGNSLEDVYRAAQAIAHSAALAVDEGLIDGWVYRIGDCSPQPALGDAGAAKIGDVVSARGGNFEHSYFAANLGSARGHNTLAAQGSEQFMLILNPDAIVAPDTVSELLKARNEDIGVCEARQVPIEHPKDYDAATGDTSWASTACALTTRDVFDRVGGFDADTFFLYCDDVDYSWRVKLAGLRVVYVPAATVFHDKRLTVDGGWIASAAERYYSAEAALLLPLKYSRADVARHVRSLFVDSEDEQVAKALAEVDRRKSAGELPKLLDPQHKVAQFVGHNYARHRFP